jgi:hypothetical protein
MSRRPTTLPSSLQTGCKQTEHRVSDYSGTTARGLYQVTEVLLHHQLQCLRRTSRVPGHHWVPRHDGANGSDMRVEAFRGHLAMCGQRERLESSERNSLGKPSPWP